ncbi:hypothetical protein EDC94DRAFT_487308, partial [Helicostylum pulchrum]
LTVYGFEEEPISSIKIARRNKDAIFSSIFDMNTVDETCKINSLYIALSPGMKFVRILGVKNNQLISSEPKKLTYLEKILQNGSVRKE